MEADSVTASQNTISQPKIVKTEGSNKYDNIHCSLEDKSGNLWFGSTGEGVYRFDGKSFAHFTKKDGLNCNAVWSLLEDRSGIIWFGTDSGLCKFDGKIFSPVAIVTENSTKTNSKDPGAIWSLLQDKNGKIWIGASEGVYCYDGKSFSHFLENDQFPNENKLQLKMIQCMLEDRNGNIWFGSGLGAREGVCRFDGKSITNFNGFTEANVRDIIEDQSGKIWIALQSRFVYVYDGNAFSDFTMQLNLDPRFNNKMFEDRSGRIWFGADYKGDAIDAPDDGLCFYNPAVTQSMSSNAITYFSWADGFTSNSVFCFLQDKSGNIWIGTRNTGLYKYDGKVFTNYAE